MRESAHALIREYPREFNEQDQKEHIDDLIQRFGNRHLGDTVYRVGRDLPRKLGFDGRLIGAARLDMKHGITPENTALGIAAAFFFRAVDENGQLFENDRQFSRELEQNGVDRILQDVCGLHLEEHRKLATLIKDAYGTLIG